MLRKITDATYNFPFSQKPLALSPSFLMSIDLGKGFFIDTYLTYIYEVPKTLNRYGYSKVDSKLFNLNYTKSSGFSDTSLAISLLPSAIASPTLFESEAID